MIWRCPHCGRQIQLPDPDDYDADELGKDPEDDGA